jgi:hypothetical protein
MVNQVPPRVTRALRLSTLVDQQLWFLGCDIRHAEGNALMEFGFERHRAPDAGQPSCYVLTLNTQCVVACWGFAVYCGPLGAARSTPAPCGALLLRHALGSRVTLQPLSLPLHARQALPAHRAPESRIERETMEIHLGRLAHTLARYEQWAVTALGDAYRRSTLRDLPRHKRRRFVATPDLSASWLATPWTSQLTTSPATTAAPAPHRVG